MSTSGFRCESSRARLRGATWGRRNASNGLFSGCSPRVARRSQEWKTTIAPVKWTDKDRIAQIKDNVEYVLRRHPFFLKPEDFKNDALFLRPEYGTPSFDWDMVDIIDFTCELQTKFSIEIRFVVVCREVCCPVFTSADAPLSQRRGHVPGLHPTARRLQLFVLARRRAEG